MTIMNDYKYKNYIDFTLSLISLQVFDFTNWPHEKLELAKYGNDDIQGIIQHFASQFSNKKQAICEEWLTLKIKCAKMRTSSPIDVYSTLLKSQPEGMQNILSLVELMMSLSVSTAKVERGFSEMNQEKTDKRTRMHQNTLKSLMVINIDGPTCEDFKPDSAVALWFKSGPGTRHITGHKSVSQSEVNEAFRQSAVKKVSSVPVDSVTFQGVKLF